MLLNCAVLETRAGRYLLSSAAWIFIVGIFSPVSCIIWTVKDGTDAAFETRFKESLSARYQRLTLSAVAAMLAVGCMPSPQTRRKKEEDSRGDDLLNSVQESKQFLMEGKLVLGGCSSIGLLISQQPLIGCLAACVALLVTAHSQVQSLRANRNMPLAAVANVPESESLLHEHSSHYQSVIPRTLITTSFIFCAARSLALWVSILEGCDDAMRDVHAPACFPSLATIILPGFLAFGSLVRIGIVATVKNRKHDEFEAACVWVPTFAFHACGLWVLLKVLADISHHPVREVFSLWRLPIMEEIIVLAAVMALWAALLLFSAVISACFHLLQDDGWPLFILFQSIGILLFELCLALLFFAHMETFLPRILQVVSAAGTTVVSVFSIVYIVWMLADHDCTEAKQEVEDDVALPPASPKLIELVARGFH